MSARPEFLKVFGITSSNLDQLRARNQLAFAFGRDGPAAPGYYRPLDFVGYAITGRVEPISGRQMAARIVREHWDVWLDAVRLAEWGASGATGGNVVAFFVGRRRIPTEAYYVTSGTFMAIAQDIAVLPEGLPSPVAPIGIEALLAELRANASAAGIDLSAPFFPPPDHPDQAGLKRLLDGIVEMSELRGRMAPPLRQIHARARRLEKMWPTEISPSNTRSIGVH
jgi:hypothetical protein